MTKKERGGKRGREKRRQGGGKISPKALPAAKRWDRWRDQNTRSQQHSTEERPINGLDQGSVLTVLSSQGGQRVTPEGRRCLITLLQLSLSSNNTETIFLAENTFK